LPSAPEAQSFSVKRSQVEFHNFASLGETERAIAYYLDENVRRAAVIEAHSGFIGRMTPFLEIGRQRRAHQLYAGQSVWRGRLRARYLRRRLCDTVSP
jgi:hypothetical protein